MGHFLTANGVTTEERKRSIFLSVIGPKTYKLLCSLVSPNKPGDKSFAELVQALKSHYNPEPSEIVERYKFHTRFRKPGESVATFVSELRTLAQTCNFGDSLGDMLRDQLVCGINDDYIQRHLACGVCRVGCSHRAGDEIFVETSSSLSTKPLSWISIQFQE